MSEKLTKDDLMWTIDEIDNYGRLRVSHVENHYSDSTGYGDDLLMKLMRVVKEQRKLLDKYARLTAKLTGASRPRARREWIKKWANFWNDDFYSHKTSRHVEPYIEEMLEEIGVVVE